MGERSGVVNESEAAMTDEREKRERVYTGNIRWCHRRLCWVFEFDTWHESIDELLIGRHDCRVIVEDEP